MDDLLRVLDRKERKNNEILADSLQRLSRNNTVASRTFRQTIEMADLPDHRKVLFINRFVRHVEELEKKKRLTTRMAGFLNGTVSIGSVVTPALLSIQYLDTSDESYIFWTTWGISLITGVSTAFLSLFKLNQAKQVYADVLRKLVSEGTKFLSLTDEYSTRYELNAHDTLYPKFASAVEAIILSETRAQGSTHSNAQQEEKEEVELKQVSTRKV